MCVCVCVCEADETSDAAPAGVCVCAYLPVCVMPVGESVQWLRLSVNLACVADGLDWTGLD